MFFIGLSPSLIPYILIGLCSLIWFLNGGITIENNDTPENINQTEVSQEIDNTYSIDYENYLFFKDDNHEIIQQFFHVRKIFPYSYLIYSQIFYNSFLFRGPPKSLLLF